jgi:hypothetical protein
MYCRYKDFLNFASYEIRDASAASMSTRSLSSQHCESSYRVGSGDSGTRNIPHEERQSTSKNALLDSTRHIEVHVVSDSGSKVVYDFHVVRIKRGLLNPCWLTERLLKRHL